jgi:hypothetical protein
MSCSLSCYVPCLVFNCLLSWTGFCNVCRYLVFSSCITSNIGLYVLMYVSFICIPSYKNDTYIPSIRGNTRTEHQTATDKHYKNKNQSNTTSSWKQDKERNVTGNTTRKNVSTQTSKITQNSLINWKCSLLSFVQQFYCFYFVRWSHIHYMFQLHTKKNIFTF